jgi:hypothetical protein
LIFVIIRHRRHPADKLTIPWILIGFILGRKPRIQLVAIPNRPSVNADWTRDLSLLHQSIKHGCAHTYIFCRLFPIQTTRRARRWEYMNAPSHERNQIGTLDITFFPFPHVPFAYLLSNIVFVQLKVINMG